jgi:DNA polymerase-3 subunit delta'
MDPGHPVFRQLAALASPQLYLCRRPWDDKAERLRTAITVDEIRSLTGFFQLSATDGGARVAIIDAADEMNAAAANALLKILEEPPARAVLLLVVHRPAALLPTIRSRCRELRLAPLGPEPLAAALAAAGSPADPAAAPLLAALAAGSAGAAFRLAAAEAPARYAEIVDLLAGTPLDRRRAIALAEAAGGRQSARYELTLELVGAALGRLALAGAGAPVPALTAAEADTAARLAGTPAQARLWAELVPRLAERTAHARAVNLDPAQVILDTLLLIDATAAEARARAA